MTLPSYDKAAEYLAARDTLNLLAQTGGNSGEPRYDAAADRFDKALLAWCHEVDAYYCSQDDTYDDSLARIITGVVPLLRAWLASDDVTVAEHEELEARTRQMLGEVVDNDTTKE